MYDNICCRDRLGYVKIEELKFVFSHLEDKMPPDEVEEMIKEADHDGNGQISFDGTLKLVKLWKLDGYLAFQHFKFIQAMIKYPVNSFASSAEFINSYSPLDSDFRSFGFFYLHVT